MDLRVELEFDEAQKVVVEVLKECIELEMAFDRDDSFIHSALRVLSDFACYFDDYDDYRQNVLERFYAKKESS